ncbi:MAG TPA: nicotinate-nucleotide adenylyltransferase [Acidimicrobiales bacterium]|nr:nicotinate-nucleotide adenylyltransferase [Acidimicrobiales bacterium]
MPVPRHGGRPGRPRIGVFGGTFDPIHRGHVELAEAVRNALGLDRMLVVVANRPWQKEDRPVTPAEDRYAMVAAALADHPGLEPSRIELDRGGPSYTVDTVRQLLAEEPGAEVVVVVGTDVVAALDTWHEPEALRDLATLAVVDRPGVAVVEPPPGWRVVHVEVSPVDVSSTDLRARIEAGQPVGDSVPEAVIRCVSERGLYATGR